MVGNEGFETAADGRRSRVGSITFRVDTLILEDTRIGTELRIEVLGNTPAVVEEVQDVLDVEAELQLVDGVADLDLEVVLVADVEAVDPRAVEAVRLCVFALVVAETNFNLSNAISFAITACSTASFLRCTEALKSRMSSTGIAKLTPTFQ